MTERRFHARWPSDAGFSELDLHFARLMMRIAAAEDPALARAAALASRATANGDVCVRLADFSIMHPPAGSEATGAEDQSPDISPRSAGEGLGVREARSAAGDEGRGAGEEQSATGENLDRAAGALLKQPVAAQSDRKALRKRSARDAALRERQAVLPLFDEPVSFPHPNPSPEGRRPADHPVPLDRDSLQPRISEAAGGISPLPSGLSGEAPGVRENDDGESTTERVISAASVLPLHDWIARLRRAPVVGRPGEFRPLILDDEGRLYLYRYWDYEKRVAESLLARAGDVPEIDEARLRAGLERYFPDPRDVEQKVAAAMAVLRRLCVISGGPGTGKTTTVVKILALLAEQARGRKLAIGLAAPTGKAAARVQDAIRTALDRLGLNADGRAAMPIEAHTLHRLLGARPDSIYYRHNRENPLALDVLVVDEASMADLALTAKLLDALPTGTRLILLGDKDQLASVEAGSVLGDICADAGVSAAFAKRLARVSGVSTREIPATLRAPAPLSDSIALLERSYRFGPASGIGALARLINQGKGLEAFALLKAGSHEDITWRATREAELRSALARCATEQLRQYFDAVRSGRAPHEIFARFNAFRVLCAHRTGAAGVGAINRMIEEALDDERLIDARHAWYAGRPVMITRNDYNLRLFNGDVGITLPDPDADNRLKVYFPGLESASADSDRALRKFSPARLPDHETVYAMTIHKSQGSEFGHVLIVLPDEPSPILTRELVYTGITRAMKRVEMWGTEATFSHAVERRLVRASALKERLWTTPRT